MLHRGSLRHRRLFLHAAADADSVGNFLAADIRHNAGKVKSLTGQGHVYTIKGAENYLNSCLMHCVLDLFNITSFDPVREKNQNPC